MIDLQRLISTLRKALSLSVASLTVLVGEDNPNLLTTKQGSPGSRF